MSSAAGGRLPALDGLRGTVIFVLLVHFTRQLNWTGSPATVLFLFDALGTIGLNMFFTLSGFLITGILVDTVNAPQYFRTFYMRRALRILPLYYGTLVGYSVLLPALSPWFAPLELHGIQHIYYWLHLANVPMALARDVVPATEHFWSLAVEEQFYFLWPLVVFAVGRDGLRRICILCLVLSPLFRLTFATLWPGSLAAYALTPARLDGLAFGGLLAIIARSEGGPERIARWFWPVAVPTLTLTAVALAGLGRHVYWVTDGFYLNAAIYLGTLPVLATLRARPHGPWRRLLSIRPLRQLGTYSYGMYVLHLPLAYVLDRAGILTLPRGSDSIATATIYCGIMVPATIAAAAGSWHFFEKPFVTLKDRFAYTRSPRAGREAATSGRSAGTALR